MTAVSAVTSLNSTKDKKGPGLQGVFKHQYLSVSGLPAMMSGC